LVCFVFIGLFLPALKRRAQQPIYTEGPTWHLKKQGTPTMGGIGFITGGAFCICLLLLFGRAFLSDTQRFSLAIDYLFVFLNGIIGMYDDMKKIKHKQNEGLRPMEKILYQTMICALYLFARAKFIGISTTISIAGNEIALGFLFYPLVLFIMLGIINCANLTDGIDGLASSVAFSIGLFLFLFTKSIVSSASVLSVIFMCSALAFLLYNKHPARIFMGDCGSLYFGALAVSISLSLPNPFLILLFGAVYVIEGVSVVLQVAYYKMTKKRIFLMAPLHHHLELKGMKEQGICLCGILVTTVFSLLAFLIR
jgi:phospho-N-acetylmuramoyl-pentapeptide-transferase